MRRVILLGLLMLPWGMISKSQSLDMPSATEKARLDSLFMNSYTYHLKDKNLSKASLKQGNLLSYLEKSYFLPKAIYPDAHPPVVYYRDEYTAYRDSIYTYGCRAFDTTMTNMYNTFMSVLDSVCEREGVYNPAKWTNTFSTHGIIGTTLG